MANEFVARRGLKVLTNGIQVTGSSEINGALTVTSISGDGTALTNVTGSYVEFSNVQGLTAFSSSVDSRLDAQEAFSSSLDAAFVSEAELTNLSSSFDTRLDTAEAAIDAVEARAGLLETATSSLDARLDAVETTTSSFAGRLNAIESITGSLATSGDVSALSSSFDTRVGTAEADIDAVEARASLLETATSSLEARADLLEAATASLDGRLDAVESFTSSIDTTIKTKLNAENVISGSSQVQLSGITGTTFATADFTFPQNLTVQGNITAQEFYTEFVSSSVIFESGSTKFGDTSDDIHAFTGSLNVVGHASASAFSGSFHGDGSGLTNLVTTLSVTGSNASAGSVDLKTQGLSFSNGEGIVTSVSGQTVTITGEDATTSNKGLASFNGTHFSVSSGAVSAKNITLNGSTVTLGGSLNLGLSSVTGQGASTTDQVTLAGGAVIHGVLYTSGSGASIVGPVSNQVIAQVAVASYDAAHFDYVIKDGTNFRTGTVLAVWDGSSIEYTETSTNDIGDTSGATFVTDISGGNARLKFSVTSGTWTVRTSVRAF